MSNKTILRYTANQRTNHWLVAILFFMAGLSGLALFHPALFWLSNLFGGGPWTRILHPFMGVVMFVLFLGLVMRFWRANYFIANDRLWLQAHRPGDEERGGGRAAHRQVQPRAEAAVLDFAAVHAGAAVHRAGDLARVFQRVFRHHRDSLGDAAACAGRVSC